MRTAILAFGFLLVASTAAAATPARVIFPGARDRSFVGAGGILEPVNVEIVFADVVIQPDGKIVAVAAEHDTGAIMLVRYDGAGALDRSFGDDGIVRTRLARGGSPAALALTIRGEIVVAGTTFDAPENPVVDGSDFAVLRYAADGTLDPTFGEGGVVVTDVGPVEDAGAVLVQDDRVIVMGAVNRDDPTAPDGALVLIGYALDGTLDPTFGEGGIARVSGLAQQEFSAAGAVEEPDGHIVVAGSATIHVQGVGSVTRVVRFDRDGHAPQPFASVFGFAVGVARRSDGKLLLNGIANGPSRAMLIRYDPDGSLDQGFGDAGLFALTERGAPHRAIAIDDQDRIILADSVLVRHLPDGPLDASFGINGEAEGAIGVGFRSLVFQPDGKIVGAGGLCVRNRLNDIFCFKALARYESDRTQLCGDADGNGTFSVSDGVAALRLAAGLASRCSIAVCDVDGSGDVSVSDGVNVLRAAGELSAVLHCGVE